MTEEEYRGILAKDAGNAVFIEYAKLLIAQDRLPAALMVCLKGLSSSPGERRGRLMLARVFYELGMLPFAAREIEALSLDLPECGSLRSLRDRLSPGYSPQGSSGGTEEGMVAEMDLAFDELDGEGGDKAE